MFGPNKTIDFNYKIKSHHREPLFMDVIKDLKQEFKAKFNIADDYEVVFVTGSGTLAVESFIFSTLKKLNVVGFDGEFKQRWNSLIKHYNKKDENGEKFCVQLETSASTINDSQNAYFIDAVSSFPYYDIPKETKVWVTVSSKILGAAPVLGIIVFHKDVLNDLVSEDVFTYLNVKRMYNSSLLNQTHHTPAMPLYIDLLERVKAYDIEAMRNQINRNSDLIVNALGKENVIGETRCPVITVKPNVIPHDLALKYSIYGSYVKDHLYQIFTYVEADSLYEKLAQEIKERVRIN